MDDTERVLDPWLALVWCLLGAAFWVWNGIFVVTSDARPPLDALLLALTMVLVGVCTGIALNVAFALMRTGRYSREATHEAPPLWLLPMSIGILGMATAPVFDGTLTNVFDWVLLAGGSLTSGFVLGTTPTVRIRRRHSSPASTLHAERS